MWFQKQIFLNALRWMQNFKISRPFTLGPLYRKYLSCFELSGVNALWCYPSKIFKEIQIFEKIRPINNARPGQINEKKAWWIICWRKRTIRQNQRIRSYVIRNYLRIGTKTFIWYSWLHNYRISRNFPQ